MSHPAASGFGVQAVTGPMSGPSTLSFQGKSYADLREVHAHIISLDVSIRIEAVQQFNEQLLRFSAASEDMILAWEELVSDATALGFDDNETAMLLQANNASLIEKAEDIRKARGRKMVAMERLEVEVMSWKRGELFWEDLKGLRDVKGYHFFTELGRIFKQENALDGILLLNDEILKRNRSPAVGKHSRGGLTSRDVEKAAKGKGKAAHERYFTEDLIEYGLTFNSYGLLVRGVYTDAPFPAFRDEEALGSPITVTTRIAPDVPESLAVTSPVIPTAPPPSKRKERVGSTSKDLTPTPTPIPSRTSPRKRQKKATEIDCDCEMPDDWKNAVEICLEDRGFSEIRNLMSMFVGEGAGVPCLGHLRMFARAIDLEVLNQDHVTLLGQLKAVYTNVRNRQSFRNAWVRKDTRGLFRKLRHILGAQTKASLGNEKFAVVSTEMGRFDTTKLAPWSHIRDIDFKVVNASVGDGLYGWIFGKEFETLLSLLKEEVAMYLHHYRRTGRKEGSLIRNMYFSIGAQLIRQDPSLYAAHVNLRADHATTLVSYPYPPRFYSKADGLIDAVHYEGEPGKVEVSSAIQDEVVLSGGALRVGMPSASQEAVRGFVMQRRLENKGPLLLTKGAIAQDFEAFLEADGSSWEETDLKDGDVVFSKHGIPVRHSFELQEDRLSYTTGYVQIYSDGTLENGADYEDIVKSHNLREIPRDPRYGGEPDVDGFLANVPLTGCGALSDCLVGRLPWSDLAV
jgi:hypothetical protein